MSYLSDFERSFSEHTLAVVKAYSGEYGATLLINCLLGLLVVPKETMLHAIPEAPLSELKSCGIEPSCVRATGEFKGKNDPDLKTLRGLVFNMRHAVAHFRIKPISSDGKIQAFEFEKRPRPARRSSARRTARIRHTTLCSFESAVRRMRYN